VKIRRLKEEEQLKIREEKLKEEKREKERLLVERELKERRIKRKAKEYAGIFADVPDLPGLRSREEQKEAMERSNQLAEALGLGGTLEEAPVAVPGPEAASVPVSSSAPAAAAVDAAGTSS